MTRHIVLGNGNILVCLDNYSRVRDFYFPYVGLENHVSGNIHKIGISIDGKFLWLDSSEWSWELRYDEKSLISFSIARNNKRGIELEIKDAVHHEKNVFIREVKIKNLLESKRQLKIFFHQVFEISESNSGLTAYYDPINQAIIQYKGRRYFLTRLLAEGLSFDDYATGIYDPYNNKSTSFDAEDFRLSKNPIEHGSVDSVIASSIYLEEKAEKKINYWVAVGKKYKVVSNINKFVMEKGPGILFKEIETYWNKWLSKSRLNVKELDNKIINMFNRSLLILRANTDNNGAIIASNDTGTMYFKKDNYSYMWPRDGALVARALDKTGHSEMTNSFFKFCSDILSDRGCLLHKYRPDKSFGSSWHPWINGDEVQLPIQEDETALVLDALWKHYLKYKEKEYLKSIYPKFIKPIAEFMFSFRNTETGLPNASYDLWEEKLGIHTFTCSTVYAGLSAAANFAKEFDKLKDYEKYKKAAEEVKSGIIKYLYDENEKSFIKGLLYEDKDFIPDKTIDISTGYAIFEYGILDINDSRVEATMNRILEHLKVKTYIGGYARYAGDMYYRTNPDTDMIPGNPWFISFLWIAEYYIARSKNLTDLEKVKEIFNWVIKNSLETGVLAEQIEPFTGKPLSATPLTWSHAAFIIAIVKWVEKSKESTKNKSST